MTPHSMPVKLWEAMSAVLRLAADELSMPGVLWHLHTLTTP